MPKLRQKGNLSFFNRRRIVTFFLRTIASAIALLIIAAGTIAIIGLRDEIDRADVAIVLGNTVDLNGKPSPRLQARLDKTIELYRRGLFADAIVSGGVGAEGFDEAVVMKEYLVDRGLPAERVHVDSLGNDTYLTAKHAARLMSERKWRRAIAISQYFHRPRTKLALQRFGIETVYTAHADFFELRDLYSTVREVFSYCSYQLRTFR
jgi:vancomycin permeability regulator SanA